MKDLSNIFPMTPHDVLHTALFWGSVVLKLRSAYVVSLNTMEVGGALL